MTMLASRAQLRGLFLRRALFIVPAVLLLGFLSGRLANSGPGNDWFAALVKPSIYPPPAAFGIVWSILYVLIGLAAAMVAAAYGARGRSGALVLFVVQLAVNLAWTPVFFGLHRMTWALGVIAMLDVLVIVTTIAFWRVRWLAGALLLPYLAWILFATALNYQFLAANPGADGVDSSGAAARLAI
jgi:tryptophan-rich sensory protein